MRILRRLAIFAAVGLVPSVALADLPDYYLGFGGGANFLQESDVDGAGINVDADFDAGLAGIVSFGHRYESGFRAELEFGYRGNDLDSVSGVAGNGDVNAMSGMINLLFDFNPKSDFSPYLGIGAGIGRVSADGATPFGGAAIDDDDTGFAYQGIAGLSYKLLPSIDLFGDYRYFATQTLELTTDAGVGVDADYASHTIMIGFRWNFGGKKSAPPVEPKPMKVAEPEPMMEPEPEPMMEPEPAPEPEVVVPEVPRTYLVFFDFDRSNLTPEALSIVIAAAQNAQSAGITRIEATGHADRSGPEAYNMRLSTRRAESVRAELIRRGIAAGDIVIFAKGETEPLVPTNDGVKEPQNRRVEIVLK